MFFSFATRSITHIAAYLYPSYSTYKALSTSSAVLPGRDRELERWLEYWCILGTFLALESLVGWWVIGWWFPFYDEIKLVSVLWMIAPQVEGSTVLYSYYLAPFFTSHENDIDAVLGDLRSLIGGYVQRVIVWAWAQARERINPFGLSLTSPSTTSTPRPPPSDGSLPASHSGLYPSTSSERYAIPPSLRAGSGSGFSSDPVGGIPPAPPTPHSQAFQFASSLIAQYGPSVLSQAQARFIPTNSHHIASGPEAAAIASSSSTPTQPASQRPVIAHQPSSSSSSSTSSLFETNNPVAVRRRRAELEAELAALRSPPTHEPGTGSGTPPSASTRTGSAPRSRASSDENLLGKSTWGEIEREEGIEGGGDKGNDGTAGNVGGGWLRGWGSPRAAGSGTSASYRRFSRGPGDKDD